MGVFAKINNGFETLDVTLTSPVNVLPSAFCSIQYDESSRPLLGVDRGGEASQTITVTNLGNIPLDAVIEASLDAEDWDVALSESDLSGIAPGENFELEVTVSSNDDTSTGIEELSISCQESKLSWR